MCEKPEMGEAVTSAEEIARRDRELLALGLCSNSELEEGAPLSEEERRKLARVRSRLNARDLVELDDYWIRRLLRGCWSCSDEVVVATFSRVARGRKEFSAANVPPSQLRDFATRCMRSVLGGEDLYGHVVWAEQLLDVRSLGSRSDVFLARGRLTECVERRKRLASARLGVMRYKQVYVLDVGPISVGSVMASVEARATVKALLSFGAKFFPGGAFKIFIVNAPPLFRSAYTLLSPLIAPSTRDKIRILGTDFLKIMAADGVPSDAVPTLIGGKHPGCDLLDLILPPPCPKVRFSGSFSEELDENDGLCTNRRRFKSPPPPPFFDTENRISLSDSRGCPPNATASFFTIGLSSLFLFSSCASRAPRHRPASPTSRLTNRRIRFSSSSSCFGISAVPIDSNPSQSSHFSSTLSIAPSDCSQSEPSLIQSIDDALPRHVRQPARSA